MTIIFQVAEQTLQRWKRTCPEASGCDRNCESGTGDEVGEAVGSKVGVPASEKPTAHVISPTIAINSITPPPLLGDGIVIAGGLADNNTARMRGADGGCDSVELVFAGWLSQKQLLV